ncbi:hypothetical protein QCA50_011568 [Cerrena zonata]|uniref:Uncharacterized protein n=1 Tax=Cerrena zonata TaxID=2478898 RepID=A0AAW0G252_9APHY
MAGGLLGCRRPHGTGGSTEDLDEAGGMQGTVYEHGVVRTQPCLLQEASACLWLHAPRALALVSLDGTVGGWTWTSDYGESLFTVCPPRVCRTAERLGDAFILVFSQSCPGI